MHVLAVKAGTDDSEPDMIRTVSAAKLGSFGNREANVIWYDIGRACKTTQKECDRTQSEFGFSLSALWPLKCVICKFLIREF